MEKMLCVNYHVTLIKPWALPSIKSHSQGAANPLNAVGVGDYSAPAFVDIDGDGDKDAFIGAGDGTLCYYKNTGTSTVMVDLDDRFTYRQVIWINSGKLKA